MPVPVSSFSWYGTFVLGLAHLWLGEGMREGREGGREGRGWNASMTTIKKNKWEGSIYLPPSPSPSLLLTFVVVLGLAHLV